LKALKKKTDEEEDEEDEDYEPKSQITQIGVFIHDLI
jgi:hypothetical protein